MKKNILLDTCTSYEIWMDVPIPIWGRKGNGYIFDSDYITDEEAKAEVEEYLGLEVEIAKTISFDPRSVR